MTKQGDSGDGPAATRGLSSSDSEDPATAGGARLRRSRSSAPQFSARSSGMLIEVEPMFLESQSFPELDHFLWAYRVTIRNERVEPVTLLDRYWKLMDKTGACREVRGEGVIGETPRIEPGEAFVYTSSAPLPTPSGMMEGEYGLLGSDGERFIARIPAFSLDSPHDRRTLN